MKFNVGDIVPFEQVNEACDWVNEYQNGFYLKDFELDEDGNMQLIVCQFPQPSQEENGDSQSKQAGSPFRAHSPESDRASRS